MNIPEQNRRESYEETNKSVVGVCQEVYSLLLHHGPKSAWQLAGMMHRQVYTVRPRLSELCDMGRIKPVGRLYAENTTRYETVWGVVDKQLELI